VIGEMGKWGEVGKDEYLNSGSMKGQGKRIGARIYQENKSAC